VVVVTKEIQTKLQTFIKTLPTSGVDEKRRKKYEEDVKKVA